MLGKGDKGHDRRVVDDDVQPAPALDNGVGGGHHNTRIAHIGQPGQHLAAVAADLVGGERQLGCVDVGDAKPRPSLCQPTRNPGAKAAPGAGHPGNSIF